MSRYILDEWMNFHPGSFKIEYFAGYFYLLPLLHHLQVRIPGNTLMRCQRSEEKVDSMVAIAFHATLPNYKSDEEQNFRDDCSGEHCTTGSWGPERASLGCE
ncbi:hypothetical protein J6590_079286 [Homalodisca vitripennis]|nr:hypothetical protein J6590_079286 [Homalodisca vitripennis]